MSSRDEEATPPFQDLALRSPPNWTVVWFLVLLGVMHLAIAVPNFIKGRWESYLSLFFGVLFVSLGVLSWRCRFELAVVSSRRRLLLRHGLRRLCFERSVPFSHV